MSSWPYGVVRSSRNDTREARIWITPWNHFSFFKLRTEHYESDVLFFLLPFFFYVRQKFFRLIFLKKYRIAVSIKAYKLTVILRYALAFLIHGLAHKSLWRLWLKRVNGSEVKRDRKTQSQIRIGWGVGVGGGGGKTSVSGWKEEEWAQIVRNRSSFGFIISLNEVEWSWIFYFYFGGHKGLEKRAGNRNQEFQGVLPRGEWHSGSLTKRVS